MNQKILDYLYKKHDCAVDISHLIKVPRAIVENNKKYKITDDGKVLVHDREGHVWESSLGAVILINGSSCSDKFREWFEYWEDCYFIGKNRKEA